jgi:N-acyl-D-amino-acid deacylase
MHRCLWPLAFVLVLLAGPAVARPFDVIVRGGTLYDGTGAPPRRADLGIRGDKIAAVGDLRRERARTVVDARGLAVAPGFINMLSHSEESLLVDPRSQSELRQGVTSQIFGEFSMGPLSAEMKARRLAAQSDFSFPIPWNTLGEYLSHLEKRGTSQNFASFVSASTVREHVIGLDARRPTADELERMRQLVDREMQAGALGLTTALIYPPATYADTDELIALAKMAARHKGMYIAHIRDEGGGLLDAIDETIRIGREAGLPVEIYHLKVVGRDHWPLADAAIAKIEQARQSGLRVTADMYLYPASATGLDASIPPWAFDGGYPALYRRMQDPETRERMLREIRTPTNGWESRFHAAGSADNVLLIKFKSEALKPFTGKTLGEVARMRGKDPAETILDLVYEDQSRVGVVYFVISEDNIKKMLARPWVSLGSDGASTAPEGVFLKSSTHPRSYGNFARLLGKYVREEKILTLAEAVRRLSGLPAATLGLDRRGLLRTGYFADVVVFDPATIADRATFDRPFQYAVGVRQVFVNGIQVLKNGEPTGATPGRALRHTHP